MADIEEQAEKWVSEHFGPGKMMTYIMTTEQMLVAAYLAGSAQTQRDYLDWAKSQGWL